MNKSYLRYGKKPLAWVILSVILILIAVTVHAALPAISLNSPASFPVDI